MSSSNKKRDKDKDNKGAAAGEASTNYTSGSAERGERISDKRREEQVTTATSTASSGATSNQEDIAPRHENKTSKSQTSRDETSTAFGTTTTSTMKTMTEVPDVYQQKEQQQSYNRALDETRDSIRKSIDEARSQIPHYTQAANEYQEKTIQTAREIADNFLESQKEIINSLQSAWLPQIDAANRVCTFNWMGPRYFINIYTNMVSNFADNIFAATRLINNVVFTNMEAFKTTMQQARDDSKEFSRIYVNAARSLEQTAREALVKTTRSTHITNTYFPSTSFGSYSDGGNSFDEQKRQEIPLRQNQEDT